MSSIADLLHTLERLIGLGFSPFLALIIGFLLILAGVIGSGFLFFWRALAKERLRQDEERAGRDADREEYRSDIERRFDECETDRQELHKKVEGLERTINRMAYCPRRECPMRVPS